MSAGRCVCCWVIESDPLSFLTPEGVVVVNSAFSSLHVRPPPWMLLISDDTVESVSRQETKGITFLLCEQ